MSDDEEPDVSVPEAFEGIDPEEDEEEFLRRWQERVQKREREEIQGIFREQVAVDFEERFADGWLYDDVLDRRQHHLQRAVNIWGDSLQFAFALKVIDEEVMEVVEGYPHVDEVENEG